MSLVFSGTTPHSPLLLEGVAKKKSDKISKTKQAIEALESDLYLSYPDIIIILSSYCGQFSNFFTLVGSDKFTSNFKKFGNLKLQDSWQGAPILANKINKESSNPTQIIGKNELESSSSIPLHLLTSKLKNIKILPIGYSDLSTQQHYKFGKGLRKIIDQSNQRIAVLASGDMSHTLSKQAPGGFHDDGVVYDKRIKKYLQNQQTENILKMDEKMIENAQDYLYRSLVILLGILEEIKFDFTQYTYQESFGVGHLTANLELP